MPSEELVRAYAQAKRAHELAVEALLPLLVWMALDSVAEVLPGAHALDVCGEFNEDWLPTLRIRRVLDAGGEVLMNVEAGHDDAGVEEVIDTVNVEYLDLLVELTGDAFMGAKTIDRTSAGPSPA